MSIVRPFRDILPQIAEGVFLAETATLIGDVVIEAQASVWFGAVLRGDVGKIRVGARSNIQDLVMMHTTGGRCDAVVGSDVVVGHGAIIHSARVGDGALIGMGAILLDDAVVGEGSIVAAGSVVPPNMQIPKYSMVMGTPARVVRELGAEERSAGAHGASGYVELAAQYRGATTAG